MGSCPDTDIDPMCVYHENEIDTLKRPYTHDISPKYT